MQHPLNFNYLHASFDPNAYEPQLGKHAAAYAAEIAAAKASPPSSLNIHELRETTTAFLEGKWMPYPSGLSADSYQKTVIGEMPCYQMLHATPESVPTLVMYFAGAFCLSSMRSVQAFMANIAIRLACNVVLPDLPLAPEIKAPELLAKVDQFLQALLRSPQGKNVVLLGWSSGGNLVLTSYLNIQKSAPELRHHISHLIPLSPWIDLSMQVARFGPYQKQQRMDTTSIGAEAIFAMSRWYLPEECIGNEPAYCPAARDPQELKTLPSTTIMVGDCDGIFGDAIFITHHLKQAGAPVQLMVMKGKTHNHVGFEVLSRDGVYVPELIARVIKKQSIAEFDDVVKIFSTL